MCILADLHFMNQSTNCSCGDSNETCFPPLINVVYDMFGVYANLNCVSCKYDFDSNFRWHVAKVVAYST